MKKQTDLNKNVQDDTQRESLLNTDEFGFIAKSGKYLKKYLFIGGLAGIGLLFNGCFPGYVTSEPTYIETSRPSSPSNVHVWVDGNWTWNRQSRTYVQHDGYWDRPHHNRKFVAGHWTTTPKGHKWSKGHWANP